MKSTQVATRLTAGLLGCTLACVAPGAGAGPQQQAAAAATSTAVSVSADQPIEEVVITGSLIPQSRSVSAVPTTLITADDLVNKGYVSLADALQSQVYATGSVQGAQNYSGFTPGAQSLSMFGLSPSYTKYLIDGLPMADYPALYNGSDVITNIGGVPEDLIDHIDILPGGQSSLYGSDAIAGVVNVIMKKRLDEPVIKMRLGGFKDGGGTDRRISAAAGHVFGDTFSVIGGIEYEKVDPIWGYQRGLTSSYYGGGTEPAVAERDWVLFLPNQDYTYAFADPNNCASVTSQFGGSVARQTRAGVGDYCGTFRSGYNTIANGTESTDGYLRATADISPALQVYADTLIDHQSTKYGVGSLWWDASTLGWYYDQNIGDVVDPQHIFSPEESGGFSNHMNTADTDAWRGTLGAHGGIGQGGWTYDLGYTYTEQKLTESWRVMLTGPVDSYYDSVLGPVTGTTSDGYPIRAPDYSRFFSPVSQAQFASMSGFTNTTSRTEDTVVRGQLTNASLFTLAGGPAGIAVVAEGGNQDWRYTPDERLLNGEAWGYTAVSGNGHRSRYAITGEVRLPFKDWLALTGSSRYDSYHVSGQNVSANTYNLGLELRPVSNWLLRGRIGTAFKAPTLADEFQGQSGYYTSVVDYYGCTQFNIPSADCSTQLSYYVLGTTSGNTSLQPIRSNVSSVGTVWKPTERIQLSMDYLHWNISNEVAVQNTDQILKTEDQCHRGVLDINSPTCVAALAQVQRDSSGYIASIATPKINVSQELVNAFIAEGRWSLGLGAYGDLELQAAWTDMLTHTYRIYPGDPSINALTDPATSLSTEFKSRVNASATWNFHDWTGTIFVDRHGESPNYAATQGYAGAGSLHPWTITNLTARYRWSKNLELGLSVLNLFNVMPPADHSYPGTTSTPYNIDNYNAYGLSYYAQLSYQLGR